MKTDTISPRATNLRGALLIVSAMLTPLGEALTRPDVNWPATTVAIIGAGLIAWRCFLDQSISRREDPEENAAIHR